MKNDNNHICEQHQDPHKNEGFRPAPYQPLYFDDKYPSNEEVEDVLEFYAEDIEKRAYLNIINNGIFNSNDGRIGFHGNPFKGAFIPAVALIGDNMRTSMIVNTQNNGPRFAGISDDGYKTIDIGPVTVPCVIGSVRKAYGVYVPLCNPEAIKDSIDYLMNYYNNGMMQAENCSTCDENCIPFESKSIQESDEFYPTISIQE